MTGKRTPKRIYDYFVDGEYVGGLHDAALAVGVTDKRLHSQVVIGKTTVHGHLVEQVMIEDPEDPSTYEGRPLGLERWLARRHSTRYGGSLLPRATVNGR